MYVSDIAVPLGEAIFGKMSLNVFVGETKYGTVKLKISLSHLTDSFTLVHLSYFSVYHFQACEAVNQEFLDGGKCHGSYREKIIRFFSEQLK